MGDWKAELEALVAEFTTFEQKSKEKRGPAVPHPLEAVCGSRVPPIAPGSKYTEYEEIRNRVLKEGEHALHVAQNCGKPSRRRARRIGLAFLSC
jgi:hypothetical protein